MNPEEDSTRVLRIIADNQRKHVSYVPIDSSFEELGIDSINDVNIVFALENEFNISIPDDAARSLRSVREAADGIAKLLENGDGPAPAAV